MTTINISLPKQLHKAAKKLVTEEKYSSISEVVRAGIRRVLYDADKITENGFPGWFEDQVLESAAEPIKKSKEWKPKKMSIKHKRNDKGQTNWRLQQFSG